MRHRYDIFYLIIILIFSSQTFLFSVTKTVSSPQIYMLGARSLSLGKSNPTLSNDLSAMLINPATLGEVESVQLSGTYYRLQSYFPYRILNVAYPVDVNLPFFKEALLQRVVIGATYADVMLHNIPKTIYQDDRVRETGLYASGFRLYNFSAATSLYDFFGIDIVNAGLSLKGIQQVLPSSSAFSFGIDVGATASKYFRIPYLDQVTAGVSVQNLLSTSSKFTTGSSSSVYPSKYLFGVRADLFDSRLSLYSNTDYLSGLSFGSEFYLQPSLSIKGTFGIKNRDYSVGMGILLNKISGLKGRSYSIRLDYTYIKSSASSSLITTNLWNSVKTLSNHVVSLSVLGPSRPHPPKIIQPNKPLVILKKPLIDLEGLGQKNTAVRIYNGTSLVRTTITDKFGNWSSQKFLLKEGRNELYVKSFDLDTDLSFQSNKVIVYSDTTPPSVEVKILPESDNLKIQLYADGDLKKISGAIENQKIKFEKTTFSLEKNTAGYDPTLPTEWVASIPMMNDIANESYVTSEMKTLMLSAIDIAGNESKSSSYNFFFSIISPKDKYVHYTEELRIIGMSSNTIERIFINKNPVYIDNMNRFSIPINLKPGKNLIKIEGLTTSKATLNYYLRVVRLVTYPDLNASVSGRREIELLSTIEMLFSEKDGYFHPEKFVTRGYLSRLLIQGKTDLKEVSSDLFEDVPKNHPYAKYIQSAVNDGLIFAYPDGSFQPDLELSLSEVLFLLNNAGITDYQDFSNTDPTPITRAQLAKFLAYLPEIEPKINDLTNWEKGFKKD